MRWLIASPSLPLPFGTADARWLDLIVGELARRGEDVTCLASTEEGSSRVNAASIRAADRDVEFVHVPLCVRGGPVSRRLHSLARPMSQYREVPALVSEFESRAATADRVQIEHLFPSWLGVDRPDVVSYLHHLEVIDWEHRRDLDLRDRLTRRQMERATELILGRMSRVIGATSRLAARASSVNPDLRTGVVPVGIDPALYEAIPLPSAPVLGVIGSMHWYPSRSAAIRTLVDLWPEIHRQVPESRLVVAGWGSAEHLGHLFPIEGAELVGSVERPEDFFSQISTLIYPPVRGSGFKIKVLEAMAYGRPVVSNNEGLEGLTDRRQTVAEPIDDDAGLVARVVELLEDGAERARLGREGRTLVEDLYSPGPAVDRLLAAHEALRAPIPAER